MVINAFIFINQRMGKNDPSLKDTTISNVAPGLVRKKINQTSEKRDENLGGSRENGIFYCSTKTTGNQRQNRPKNYMFKISLLSYNLN